MKALTRIAHVLGGGKQLRSRGAAELSVVVMGASLVGGLVFGNGLTRTAVDVFDGATWFSDSPRGEVLQVNAATGQPEIRLSVGSPNDPLQVAQQSGRLLVTNQGTGTVTSIDLATLLASGRRSVGSGGGTRVLLHDGLAFVVDGKAGTIANVDPVSLTTLGRVWTSKGPISDVAIDAKGTVWALGNQGDLTGLTWSKESQVFSTTTDEQVEGVGSGGELVAHEAGVTIFSPANGAVVQVGTGRDVVTAAPGLQGSVEAAKDSPSDFVPASSSETGTVVIVGPSQVRQVDVRAMGCPKPGRPSVFGNTVYIPCEGSNKVIRLDRQGNHIGNDIITTGTGDPQIVIDNGRLFVNVPGADKGVQVMPDGSTQSFTRYDPTVPAQPVHVSQPPKPDEPEKTNTQADRDRQQGKEQGKKDQNTHWSPPNPTVTVNSPDSSGGSTGATTVTQTVTTSDHTRFTSTSTTPYVTTTRALTSTTTTTGNPPIRTTTKPPITPTTTQPPITTQPPKPPANNPPGSVSASAPGDGSVNVSWTHSGPAPSGFTVVREGTRTPLATVSGGSRSAVVTGLPAGTSVRLVVTATFASGGLSSGPSNVVSAYPNLPSEGAGVIAGGVLGNDLGPLGQEKPSRTVKVQLAPPSDWANFPGTCTLKGAFTGGSAPVACNATTATISIPRPAGTYESTHQIWVEASGAGPTVNSAEYTIQSFWDPADPQPTCDGQQPRVMSMGLSEQTAHEAWGTPALRQPCQIP